MSINVAINGYGRIGRNILRAHYEGGKKHDIRIVAVNDLGNAAALVERAVAGRQNEVAGKDAAFFIASNESAPAVLLVSTEAGLTPAYTDFIHATRSGLVE